VRLRRASLALLLLLLAWGAWGVRVRLRAAPRPPTPQGELRGAWHLHTTRSDGRGSLDEVLQAAREAGLQFLVVTDHNVITPAEAGWHDGVLVIEAHEASTRLGHIVAPGAPRALDAAEREGRPLQAIEALGGQAVLAHPFHARRPFRGWGQGPWRGLEVVSNDAAFGEVVAGRAFGRALEALATLPFDGAQAVVALVPPPGRELAMLDEALAETPPGPLRPDGQRAPGRVLLCSADAHGYPSYRAAFEAFSMHVPVAPTGDGAADGRAVLAALLDGRAACVFDAVAPAFRVALARDADGTMRLTAAAATIDPAEARLVRLGPGAGREPRAESRADGLRFTCDGGCGPGTYRAEVRRGGRPWILTNPVVVE